MAYKRGNVWYINLQIDKRRIQMPAGRTEAEAEEVKRRLKIAARFKRKQQYTVEVAAQEYLDHIKDTLSRRTWEMDRTDYYKHLQPFFRLFFLSDINNETLMNFQKQQKRQGYANRTVNMHMGLIRRILNHADRKGYIAAGDLNLRYPMLAEPKKLHASLTPAEFRAIQQVDMGKYSGPLSEQRRLQIHLALCRIRFGVFTGLRPGELAHLEWSDIDIRQRALRIQSKPHYDWIIKTNEERIVPLGSSALAVLRDVRKTGRLVFSVDREPVKSIRRSIRTAAEKAGITRNVTPNMLRHSYATLSLAAGADVKSVQMIMGHKSLTTTQKYTHGIAEAMRDAVDALDRKLATKPATVATKKRGRKTP
jgi:integrase